MKTRTLIISACVLAVSVTVICLCGSFFQFRFPCKFPVDSSYHNFCTINTNALRYFNPKIEGIEKIKSIAGSYAVDVLCIQELDCYEELPDSTFENEMESVFPYLYKRGGVALASKYPIVNIKRHRFDRTLAVYVYCDIAFGRDTVRVFNIHLQTTGINNTRNQFSEDQDLDDKYRTLKQRVKKYEELRWEQAKAVAEELYSSPYPVVLMGDFNSHPYSRVYKLLSEDLRDSFIEKGSGLGSTYKGLKGIVRTDYILHDSSIKCKGYKRIKDNISDHMAIVSSFDFSSLSN